MLAWEVYGICRGIIIVDLIIEVYLGINNYLYCIFFLLSFSFLVPTNLTIERFLLYINIVKVYSYTDIYLVYNIY